MIFGIKARQPSSRSAASIKQANDLARIPIITQQFAIMTHRPITILYRSIIE